MSDDRSPHQLNYRAPRDETDRQLSQTIGFALLTAILTVAVVAGLMFFAFSMDYNGFNAPSGIAGSIIAGSVGLALLAGLLLISRRLYQKPETRGMAVGIFVGLGIAAMIEGACFALQR